MVVYLEVEYNPIGAFISILFHCVIIKKCLVSRLGIRRKCAFYKQNLTLSFALQSYNLSLIRQSLLTFYFTDIAKKIIIQLIISYAYLQQLSRVPT